MSSYHNKTIAYRPEIDGLRAIAVIPVIFFHAGFEIFPGGYVGVDVFFVISGYLITSILLQELSHGNFSIIRFYERRAKRILPALFFVIACSFSLAWIWMLPDELKRFGQSLVAVATFSSNIYFWKNTNYFAPTAEEQPLLHTWSLAVEEQYYVFFPLFLMVCWRFCKFKVYWLIALTAALSLLLAEWLWRSQPAANFYLLPTRAWELLAGSLIAFMPQALFGKAQEYHGAPWISIAGFLMILSSLVSFTATTPSPSLYTGIPILGSVLVIIFSHRKSLIGNILSSKILVGIGLISYSAYLWHQPIFAFMRISSLKHPSQIEFALGAFASFILAYLTWRFVEQPSRVAKITQSSTLKLATICLSIILAVGITTDLNQGFENRFTLLDERVKGTLKRDVANCFDRKIDLNINIFCSISDDNPTSSADYLVLGDSHMYSLLPAFRLLENEYLITKRGAYVGYSGCPPLLNIHALRQDQIINNCFNLNERIIQISRDAGVKEVFLIARWTYYTDGGYSGDQFSFIGTSPYTSRNKENSRTAFILGLRSTLKKWHENGIKVNIVTQVPQQRYEPIKIYFKAALKNDPLVISSLSVAYKDHQKLQEWVNQLFNEYEPNNLIHLINPDSVYCNETVCKMGEISESYYFDDDHVSIIGARKLASLIKEAMH